MDRDGGGTVGLGALERELDAHVAYVLHAAQSAPIGGGPAWDALLRHYGATPVAAEVRHAFARSSGLQCGAVPAEVRRVLDALVAWAQSRCGDLARGSRDTARIDHESRLATTPEIAFTTRLATLARDHGAAYLRSIDPSSSAPDPYAVVPGVPATSVVAVSSIFANASATAGMAPWAGMGGTHVHALACPSCGASQEVARDFTCRYCRGPLAGAR